MRKYNCRRPIRANAIAAESAARLADYGLDKPKVQEVLLVPAAKQTAVMTGTVDAMSGFYNVQAAAMRIPPF